jgi:hypothetical protein
MPKASAVYPILGKPEHRKLSNLSVYESIILFILGLAAVELLVDWIRSFAYDTLGLEQTRARDTFIVLLVYMCLFVGTVYMFGIGKEYAILTD